MSGTNIFAAESAKNSINRSSNFIKQDMKGTRVWFSSLALLWLCGSLFAQSDVPGEPGRDFDFNLNILHPDRNQNSYPANYDSIHPFLDRAHGNAFTHRYANSWAGVSEPNQVRYFYLGYGDDYPRPAVGQETTVRPYSDIGNVLDFVGPGNTNPGNYWGNDSLTNDMRAYIAGQFKYVLFDAESFAERDARHKVTKVMPQKYHDEAINLMNRNPNLTVLPYFAIPLAKSSPPVYPWWNSLTYTHRLADSHGQPFAYTENGIEYSVMDIRDTTYRNQCIDSIVAIVNRYGYRAIYLDNMTEYPDVHFRQNDFERLPADIRTGGAWLSSMMSFVNTLKGRLPNKLIICNNLGLDDTTRNPPLYGRSHGVDLITSSRADGGMLESFQSTAWETLRDEAPGIMSSIYNAGKIFLCVASYTRGIDSGINQQFNLGRSDGQYYYVEGGTQDYYVASWNPIYYRLQSSYLARFLLGIQGSDMKKFAFSFQPGFTQYQFIPYYKIWNANFGAPQQTNFDLVTSRCPELGSNPNPANRDSLYNASGTIYRRTFANSLVIVNASQNYPVVVKLEFNGYKYDLFDTTTTNPGSAYIYGPYYGRRGSAKYLLLNKNEGVVLFKGSRLR